MDANVIIAIVVGVVFIVAGIIISKVKYSRRSYSDRRIDYFNSYDERMEEFRQHKSGK